MGALALISKIVGPLVARATEGAYRPGPYHLPITGGWLPDGVPINWWQCGIVPIPTSARSARVEACISAYSQTVAMCPGAHWRRNDKGGRDRVTTSALSRILRQPNDYQSISDFMLNATRWLYLQGNAFAVALRNNRFEIDELHLMDSMRCKPYLAETGDIFYQLGGNNVIEKRLGGEPLFVPARDVLHIRLHVKRYIPYPLLGETPLAAALDDVGVSGEITKQQLDFYRNQARPSAVLSTDLVLKKEQVDELRDRWNEQAKGLHQGGTPILTAGLKVQPWTMPPKDAMIADIMKFSDERIALAFRIPLQVLGISGHAPHSSTELMMQSWIATGLGFALNHIEESFGVLFQLRGQPDEYVEFDTAALLRSAFKDRISALRDGVLGGIYAPNEARELENLEAKPYGDEPRVQQQVVPLSAAAGIPKPSTTGPHPPPAPGPGAPPPAPPAPAKDYAAHVQWHARELLRAADEYDRRSVA